MSEWIPIEERTPKVGQRVKIVYTRKAWDWSRTKRVHQIETFAEYQDGTMGVDDSDLGDNGWLWEAGAEYDEEKDQYLIPAGWYEVLTSISAEYFCWLGSEETVTHWSPLDKFPPLEVDE